MNIIYNLEDLEINKIRDSTLGKFLSLSKLLCSDGVIRHGNFSKRTTTILKKEIMDFLEIKNEKTFTSIFLELEQFNILKRFIISGKGFKIFINPKYCRHINYTKNSECDELFKNTIEFENSDKYYIYKFLSSSNEILYVGRTTNIEKRIKSHINNGHLPDTCYNNIDKIQYAILKNFTDMSLYEIYYINKYFPKYNTKDKDVNNKDFTIELKEVIWIDFDFNIY